MSRAADRAERLLRELGPEGAAREDLYDRLRAFDTPGYGLRELASEDTRELLAALSDAPATATSPPTRPWPDCWAVRWNRRR